MDHETFPDYSDLEIKPRFDLPILPLPEPPTPAIIVPEPPQSRPDPAAAIAEKAITPYKFRRPLSPEADAEVPGQCKSDLLLSAIRIVASKPPSYSGDAALRDLVKRYAAQHSLDF